MVGCLWIGDLLGWQEGEVVSLTSSFWLAMRTAGNNPQPFPSIFFQLKLEGTDQVHS